jgi:DNA-binding NarL/FixJ family response regulator
VQPVEPIDSPVRVLVVDDSGLFRRAARHVLVEAGFEVVGDAEDAAAALRLATELLPDVVLLDIQLPDRDGFQVAADLRRRPNPPAIVFVSSRSRSDYGGMVERSGVRGFLDKADLSGPRLRALLA